MLFYIIFFVSMCSFLLLVTLGRKDVFPFSHYPMFSSRHDISKVKVYRIALENENGTVAWWQSPFYRYPEIVGRKLSALYNSDTVSNKANLIVSLEKNDF